MPLLGAHNVRNALAAIAVAAELGVDAERIARRAAAVRRRQAAARGRRHARTASRSTTISRTIRRRSPKRSPACAPSNPTRAHLGRLRAAVGIVVPARVPGRFRAGVRGRRRDRARARVPIDAAREPSGCRSRSWCAISSAAGQSAREAASIDDIVDTSSASIGRAISSCSCRTAASAAFTGSCSGRCRHDAADVDSHRAAGDAALDRRVRGADRSSAVNARARSRWRSAIQAARLAGRPRRRADAIGRLPCTSIR